MSGRFIRRLTRQKPRNIRALYQARCACCGGQILSGEVVTFYPPGTIAGVKSGRVAHVGGLEGTSEHCALILRMKVEEITTISVRRSTIDETVS